MRRPLAFTCLLLILLITLYTFWQGVPDYMEAYDQENISLYGYVENKEIKNDKQVIYLKNITFCNDNFPNLKSNIGAICYLDSCDMPRLGSFIMLTGKVSCFENSRNPGEFDMKNYYASIGYFFALQRCSINKESKGYSVWKEKLYQTRQYMCEINNQVYNAKDGSVMNAIILGRKNEMDTDIKELYRKAGISHILSISGLHISVIGMMFLGILNIIRVPRLIKMVIPVYFVINYSIFTGTSTGSVRAVIMFIISLSALLFLRTYDINTGLSMSALLVCISNHFVILSSGFWMSYLAVFGIAVFSKALLLYEEINNKKIRKFINIIISGFSVSFFTLPVLLYSYFEFPLYSVLLNILLVPMVSILLIFGLLALIVGIWSITMATVIGTPCHLILLLYEWICNNVQKLPGSMIIAGRPKWYLIVSFYILCILIIILKDKNTDWNLYKKEKIKTIFTLKIRYALVLISLILLLFPTNKRFKIVMLDVGQGDGICVEYKKMAIMIDGGSSSENELAKYTLVPFFKSENIKKIDYWFVTHPDSDHYSGLKEMLETPENSRGVEINNIIFPKTKSINKDANEILELCSKNNINVIFAGRGQNLQYDDMQINIIHPKAGLSWQDINDYSLVFTLKYRNFKMLFTGDATVQSEADYIEYAQDNIKDIDVYKVAHHGSMTSSSKFLLDIIKPDYALISSGRNNRYGHPSSQVLERLNDADAKIYNTQISGAIQISIGRGDNINVQGYLDN